MKLNNNINEAEFLLTDQQLKVIGSILQQKLDFYLEGYKVSTINRRVKKRMKTLQTRNVCEYIDFLNANIEEAKQLSQELLINVTAFFRDLEVFNFIKKEVLTVLWERGRASEKPTKIWITGCSTGEEAYSFAMMIRELEKEHKQRFNVKIIATDVDQSVIIKAKKGVYRIKDMLGVNKERLERFFIKKNNMYEVKKDVKKIILFTVHDVSKDPPFGKVHLVSCRNLLIYFEKRLQEKILANLNFSVGVYGFLVLGLSETAMSLKPNFRVFNSRLKIFQKINTKRLDHNFAFEVNYDNLPIMNPKYKPTAIMDEQSLMVPFQNIIYKNYSPALVVIDPQFYVQHITKNAKKFIDTPEDYTVLYNFLHLAPPMISAVVRTAMSKMKTHIDTYSFHNIRVKYEFEEKILDISVAPLETDSLSDNNYFIIKISPSKTALSADLLQKKALEDYKSINLTLQKQLEITEANLKTSIRELETSNQNLQASNEELQSTNEEYISVNEELHIINRDHQKTINDQAQLNQDLAHLMQNTEIGTLFLDAQLVIRKFTRPVTELINIRESDVGRPLEHFTYNFNHKNFLKDILQVLEDQEKIEFEIQQEDTRQWFLLRIMPYSNPQKGNHSIVINFIDIDDLKKAQVHLQESEYRYRTLFEKAFDGIIIFDLKTKKTISINQRLADYFGYTKEEMLCKHPLHLSPEYQPDGQLSSLALKKHIQKLFQNKIVQYEWQYKKVDGSTLYTEVTAFPIHAKDKSKQYVGVFRDITHQKNAQEALLLSNNRFQALFDQNAFGIALSQKGKSILKTNRMFRQMFGYTDEELSTIDLLQLTHPDDRAYSQEMIRKLFKEKATQTNFEKRYIRKDGTMFWGEISVSYFKEGNEMYSLGTIKDITKAKENEAALKQSEMRHKAIFNNTFQFTGLLNTKGILLEINETALLFGGLQLEQVIGKPVWDTYWFSTSETTKNGMKEGFKKALKGEFVRYNMEVYGANHTLRTIDFSIKPVFDEENKVAFLIPEGRDITEMLETEKKLAQKVTELAATNQKLEKYIAANLELENFAYITSHDLREPIRNIIGFTQLLQQKCQDSTDKQAKEYLQYVIDATQNLNDIVDDLLTYSKIDKSHYNMEPLNIKKLIKSVLQDLESSINANNTNIIIDIPPSTSKTIFGHKTSLYRVLLNLIANAIKFKKIDGTASQVNISVAERPKDFLFTVADNGIGIETKYFDRIFLMFKRLHTKNTYKGTGMGLSICKKIIEKHKGEIYLTSTYEEGATFYFTIPKK